jgi:RNA polymerase sigma factor (sigma-70 family)
MMGPDTREPLGAVAQPLFATTHWSVVLSTADKDSPEAAAALEQLCRTYWFPLYAYVRRRGCCPEDAQDLTQQFFVRLIEKRILSFADPARGRFRTFLLKALEHFLTDDWRHARRTKRGGGAFEVPLDGGMAEARYAAELTDTMTPERVYEERWAMTLLERVLDRMREDYTRAGKQRLFESLQDFLWDPKPSVSCPVLASGLGLTPDAFYAAVHRLRAHYRERLRAEVAHTVGNPSEVDAELHYLIGVAGAAR